MVLEQDSRRTGAAQHEWSGPEGLRRLQALMPCSTRTPATFRARIQIASVAGMRLVDFESTELFGAGPIASRGDGLELVLVLSGRTWYSAGAESWSSGMRDLDLIRHEELRRWAFPAGAHIRTLNVPAELIPQRLRPCDRSGSGRLPSSRLSAAFSGALRQGVGAALDSDGVPDSLGQGLRSLGLAVLEERLATQGECGPPTRERILDHIDQNLRDVRLSPQSIADAFDMSVRWVHYVFNDEESTVTQEIRTRRVDAVAAHLRLEPGGASLTELAVSYGFSGREQLTRTFRRRYGTTVAEYQQAVFRGEVPQPVTDGGDRLDGVA